MHPDLKDQLMDLIWEACRVNDDTLTDEYGSPPNLADGLFAIAESVDKAGRNLGTGSASGPGAIEFLGMCVKEGAATIATAITEAGRELSQALVEIDR